MLLGCIADDFTGAGDVANTLNKAGMRTRMVLGPIGIEDILDADDADAIVVALKSRSIPARDAIDQSLNALSCLRKAGAVQYMFKYCSTFDSTPEGNIGPVAEALAKELSAKAVVVCPSFPENERTVYQGHLFVGDKLINETGMQDHPVTPMTDPDIRRWLQKQCNSTVGHISYDRVQMGRQTIEQDLIEQAEANNLLVVVDALRDNDLLAIGGAVKDAILFTGGSAVAMEIPNNFRSQGLLEKHENLGVALLGPVILLAGSCSRATMAQVKQYSAQNPAFAININDLMEGHDVEQRIWKFIEKHRDSAPLVYSSASAQEVTSIQKKYGQDKVSKKTETLFGALAAKAVTQGVQKIICAGGETSGAVTQALDIAVLNIGPEIAPGVPSLYSADNSLALVLKSGNFGQVDFFARAVNQLETGHE